MSTQFESLFRWQVALCEGWIQMAALSFGAYERLWASQVKILEHQNAYFRSANIIPQGADWFDHYGKRNHDIDVEKV
jgi:hypothetical protein